MALLSGLPDNTRIAQIMAIINQDTTGMPPKDRLKHDRVVKQLLAGRKGCEQEAKTPKNLDEYNEMLLGKVRKIKEDCGKATSD